MNEKSGYLHLNGRQMVTKVWLWFIAYIADVGPAWWQDSTFNCPKRLSSYLHLELLELAVFHQFTSSLDEKQLDDLLERIGWRSLGSGGSTCIDCALNVWFFALQGLKLGFLWKTLISSFATVFISRVSNMFWTLFFSNHDAHLFMRTCSMRIFRSFKQLKVFLS